MRIALAQINCTVGDIAGNTRKIIGMIGKAREAKADLVVFPEMAVTGYPPEDLVLKPQFVDDNLLALRRIVKECRGIAVFTGFVDRKKDKLFNAGAFIVNRKTQAVYHKINLPNYAVFDEKRYFFGGDDIKIVSLKGTRIGLGICEDIWTDKGPYLEEAKRGAGIILNISASPYYKGRVSERVKMLKKRAVKTKAHIVYVNIVGGQDELVFDGGSMVFDRRGELIARAKQFEEELLIVDFEGKKNKGAWLDETEEIYNALVLGVKDYIRKNGFKDVLVGLSGGIDSALTLTIAADAIGAEAVHAVMLPSQFTSEQSVSDAYKMAKNLRVKLMQILIKDIYIRYLHDLEPHFAGRAADITEENIQARIRGNILMALSNKFGWLVLTTGNKSEMSVGYCTMYGDTAGGFAVLKDVPKNMVYKLAQWRNRRGEVIPQSIIKRAPTAELKPDQKDQDSLPPYEILDSIMKAYVEDNKSRIEIVKMGYQEKVVEKVIRLIDRAEYKRRQAPPGPRISRRAFGKDWRVPITNKYAEGQVK